ncbi:hypothetical protein SAMN05216194_105307 [Stutzerimonas kunmingensis]|nr:hypothetical protein SAMN05216194_105307 [Stutzerimonas kunmingensis]
MKLSRVSMETTTISQSQPLSVGTATRSNPVFPWKQPFTVPTLFRGARPLEATRVSMETTIHRHNTFPRHPRLEATPCSMETTIHSHNTFPRNQSLAATPCFHGNNHPQSQHVSVGTITRSYPVSMETTICSHNTFPWNHHSHLHRSAWKHPLIDTIRFHRNAVTAPSSPFAMVSPFHDARVAGRHYLAAAALTVPDCAHRRWPCDACPPRKGLCSPLHTSALAHGKRKSSKSISLN